MSIRGRVSAPRSLWGVVAVSGPAWLIAGGPLRAFMLALLNRAPQAKIEPPG